MLTLTITSRNAKESSGALRLKGSVPAVFYGPKEASTPITVDGHVLEALWKQAGETTVIALSGVGETKETLIRDVQFHPVSGKLLHADFYVLEKGKKIEIAVPLVFIGEAPAEKAGHIVVKTLYEIEIEVLPADLPRDLSVDISKLTNVGDHITAGDIAVPKSATLITGAHEIVVSVTEFKEEKIEEPVVVAPVSGTTLDGASVESTEGVIKEAPEVKKEVKKETKKDGKKE